MSVGELHLITVYLGGLLMKSIHMVVLCLTLLIQGISQSYAAQMMTAMTTSQHDASMQDMPCHENTVQQMVATDDCCDHDCECDFLSTAMTSQGFKFAKAPAVSLLTEHFYPLITLQTNHLYRPPIFA